jgi:hypothetical protein
VPEKVQELGIYNQCKMQNSLPLVGKARKMTKAPAV